MLFRLHNYGLQWSASSLVDMCRCHVGLLLVYRISLRKAPKFKSHCTMQKAQQDAKCHDQDPAPATTRHSLTQPMVLQMQRAHPAICAEKDACMIGRIFSPTLEESGWHLYRPSFSYSKYFPKNWHELTYRKLCDKKQLCLKLSKHVKMKKLYNHWDTTAMHWGRYQAKGPTAFVLIGCLSAPNGRETNTNTIAINKNHVSITI